MKRRDAIKGALALVFTAYAGTATGQTAVQERRLKLHNPRFNEDVDVVYWRDGSYQSDGLDAINRILRDHYQYWRDEAAGRDPYARSVTDIDVELIDVLHRMQQEIERRYPNIDSTFNIISGYRTVETNNILRRNGGGQASRSRHTYGDAADIRVDGLRTRDLRDIANATRGRGGVGYYPNDGFVHVDTWRRRNWSG
ncbi:MAG TPA: DUF882 domain-containing protein [Micavibrio sp.]|nr:DUF882 domain-containing protein [Micavibrio sp.]HIL27984.1 DUF882 domain-containing protein [Micavibrio sp.]